MSAWIVDKRHIDLMVSAALHYSFDHTLRWNDRETNCYMLSHYNADEVGQMLVDECVRSVRHRYPRDAEDELPGPGDNYYMQPYRFSWEPSPNAITVLKQIDCYEYQSCEHDGWLNSNSKSFCSALRVLLISKIDGYNYAPWGWPQL